MRSKPDAPLVEALGVSRVYGTDSVVAAIDDVSLSVYPGEFVSIEGPSGCGKSTLLHLLGGLDSPTFGSIRFGGVRLVDLSDDERTALRRRDIGIVLPVVDLIPTLTVWENVAIASLLDRRPISEGRERAQELLDQVKLAHRAETMAARLSTGEAQRAALARALYNDPVLLLADEPTSFLDSVRSDEVVSLLRDIADGGRAVVMATHDARAAAFADRSVRLIDGRVRATA